MLWKTSDCLNMQPLMRDSFQSAETSLQIFMFFSLGRDRTVNLTDCLSCVWLRTLTLRTLIGRWLADFLRLDFVLSLHCPSYRLLSLFEEQTLQNIQFYSERRDIQHHFWFIYGITMCVYVCLCVFLLHSVYTVVYLVAFSIMLLSLRWSWIMWIVHDSHVMC